MNVREKLHRRGAAVAVRTVKRDCRAGALRGPYRAPDAQQVLILPATDAFTTHPRFRANVALRLAESNSNPTSRCVTVDCGRTVPSASDG